LLPGNTTDEPWTGNITGINDNNVDIKVYKGNGEGVYRILSTATDWEGTSTTIESYTSAQGQGFIFDNALTSYDDITLKNNVEIVGNISLNGDQIGQGWNDYNNSDQVTGLRVTNWPDAGNLTIFYQEQVGDCDNPQADEPDPGENLPVSGNLTIGSLLRCGDLDIESVEESAKLTLTGTMYVTGNLLIGQTSASDFILDLGNQTIFCEQDITISSKCDIRGSGCIVALGDVYFSPKSGTEPGKFVFIISVSGTLTAQPSGTFYGSLAGNVEIEIKQGVDPKVEWVDYEGIDFFPNFPTDDDVILPVIITYTILDDEPE
jgi:hypothetical protein